RVAPAPDTAPERAETGTQNHEGIAGIRGVVDWLASLASDATAGVSAPGRAGTGTHRRESLRRTYETLHERGDALLRLLWSGLGSIDGLTLYGQPPGQPRTPTVGFTMREIDCETLVRNLAAEGLFVSHGNFYAETAVARLGVPE